MHWNGPAAWRAREQRAGDRLPYETHIDDCTIKLRDGALMQIIQLDGTPFETVDVEELNHRQMVREVVLRSALDARFVVYHHIVRRRIALSLPTTVGQPFAEHLSQSWHDQLAARRLYVNDQYLTIVRRPALGKTGWLERLGQVFHGTNEAGFNAEALSELHAATSALLASLGAYGARIASLYAGPTSTRSEPLEFLSAIYNGETQPVSLPDPTKDLGHYLPYKRVSFGLKALELHGVGRSSFAGILSIKEYASTTYPGIIDGMLRLPCEGVLTETYAPADRQIARERIDLALRRLKSADSDGVTQRTELQAAKDALDSSQLAFGDHHLTLLLRSDDLGDLDRIMSSAASIMADAGMVAVREDINLEPAFWGQFPGNEAFIVRRSLISSANAAGFISLHGQPMGKPTHNHWGDAIGVFETTSATPYFFNFHEGDLGNFTVVGPSGSGKTVLMNFLVAQSQKIEPRTVVFDKDRGAEIFIRASGGFYTRLVPGQPTGMNPLQLPDTPTNRAFLREWLAVILKPIDAHERNVIADAVNFNFESEPYLRRLRHFAELLVGTRKPEAGDLGTRLAPWIGAGEHAWLFDNIGDELRVDQSMLGFDMTALLDAPALRTPTMMYLFHRVDERLTGDPAIILIDEGWKALDDDFFASRLRDWLKTLRKRNAIVGFGTQSARDALDSRISSAIVEQTATAIFTPNAKARAEDYCSGFGLTEHELNIIRTLPAHARCFLVRHANHSVVLRLDLSGLPQCLKILSGNENTVRRLDVLRASVGDDPSRWYPLLVNQPWPGTPTVVPDFAVAAE
jgi:type IV secretion system protein VirB4